jgi:hypothetical protein
MSNCLSKPIDAAKSTWNVVQSIGPFLISQSDSASEAYARHLTRVAAVDAGKELLLAEIHAYSDIKKKLLKRFVAADAEERIRIRRDLDEISASLRQIKVGTQALGYLPGHTSEQSTQNPPPPTPPQQAEVSLHWMDKFSELARVHNEPWREDLLARALAVESASPGTVSPRALWLLGTLEERVFNAFATLLDLASFVADGLMIPQHQAFSNRPIPNCSLGNNIAIGNLIYQLDEVGLFADALTTSRTVCKDSTFLTGYGSSRFLVQCATSDLSISGVIPTGLGASLASFYTPKENPLGKEIFDEWLKTLDKKNFPCQQIT